MTERLSAWIVASLLVAVLWYFGAHILASAFPALDWLPELVGTVLLGCLAFIAVGLVVVVWQVHREAVAADEPWVEVPWDVRRRVW